MTRFNKILLVIVSIFVLLTDQISKYFIIKKLLGLPGVFIFKSNIITFKLEYALNNKLSFSIPFPQTIIIIITSLIVFGLSFLLFKKIKQANFLSSFLLITIISSAISNLFDRIYYGGVIDFLSFQFFQFKWAVFNLADIYIVIGIIVYLIYEFTLEKSLKEKKS